LTVNHKLIYYLISFYLVVYLRKSLQRYDKNLEYARIWPKKYRLCSHNCVKNNQNGKKMHFPVTFLLKNLLNSKNNSTFAAVLKFCNLQKCKK